jgi:hypothetical protein
MEEQDTLATATPTVTAADIICHVFDDHDPTKEVIMVSAAVNHSPSRLDEGVPAGGLQYFNIATKTMAAADRDSEKIAEADRNDIPWKDRRAIGAYQGRKSADMCFPYLIYIDDVGTKVTPASIPLAPSAIIETSPGNCHYWYILKGDPSCDDVLVCWAGMNKMLGADSIHDLSRLARLPGSVKVDKATGFAGPPAVLRAWHPERSYTVDKLRKEFGVTPEPIKARSAPTPGAEVTGRYYRDPVPEILFEMSLTAKGANIISDAEIPVVCPNAIEHSEVGDPWANYSPYGLGDEPGLRQLNCFHEHCKGKHRLGELLEQVKQHSQRVFTADEPHEVPDGVANRITNIHGFASRHILVTAAYGRGAGYYDRLTREIHSNDAVNQKYGHICKGLVTKNYRELSAAQKVTAVGPAYWPGVVEHLIEVRGRPMVNTFRPNKYDLRKREDIPVVTDADIPLWIEHMHWMFPVQRDFEIVMGWMSHVCQNPTEKSNWQLLVVSIIQGVGKDLCIAGPLRERFSYSCKDITPELMKESFGDWLDEAQMLILQEVMGMDGKIEQANALKPFFTNDPPNIDFKSKGSKPRNVQNLMFFLMFSNHPESAFHLEKDDRRTAGIEIAPPKAEVVAKKQRGDFKPLSDWLKKDGGYGMVVDNLCQREIPKWLDFQGDAPTTDYKERLIDSCAGTLAEVLQEEMQKVRSPLSGKVISVSEVTSQLQFMEHITSVKGGKSSRSVGRALTALGLQKHEVKACKALATVLGLKPKANLKLYTAVGFDGELQETYFREYYHRKFPGVPVPARLDD